MNLRQNMTLVVCFSVAAYFYSVAYQDFSGSTGYGLLWRSGPNQNNLNYGLMLTIVIGIISPLIVSINIYILVNKLMFSKEELDIVDAIGLCGIITAAIIGFDIHSSNHNGWDIVRSMPRVMGPSALGILSSIIISIKFKEQKIRNFQFYSMLYWVIVYFMYIIK
jgi:hypothetical protein